MKLERKGVEFQPVVITLESQFEVDVLRQMVGMVQGLGKVRVFVNKMYESLRPLSTDVYPVDGYFELGSNLVINVEAEHL